jgi:hypothetical protein
MNDGFCNARPVHTFFMGAVSQRAKTGIISLLNVGDFVFCGEIQ